MGLVPTLKKGNTMSDVSGTAHFYHTIPVTITGDQLRELSRKIHEEHSNDTNYLVCLSDTVASHSDVVGRPERLGLNKKFYRPDQIRLIPWVSKNQTEALNVEADADGHFRVEYVGPGQIHPHLTNYYSILSSISLSFNECAHLYLCVKEWARWTSIDKDDQETAFREMLEKLAAAPSFETARKVLPLEVRMKLAHAPEDLVSLAWRGLKDILLGVPVDPKYYADLQPA